MQCSFFTFRIMLDFALKHILTSLKQMLERMSVVVEYLCCSVDMLIEFSLCSAVVAVFFASRSLRHTVEW